jgi:hypothetical protein
MSLPKIICEYLDGTRIFAILKDPRFANFKELRIELLKFHKTYDRMRNVAESHSTMENLRFKPIFG